MKMQDSKGQSAVFQCKAYDMMEVMLKSGADPNITDNAGRTPLFYCLEETMLRKLLAQSNANFRIRDVNGRSLLFYTKDKYTAAYLLNKGVDPKVLDNNGNEAPIVTTLRKEQKLTQMIFPDLSKLQNGIDDSWNEKKFDEYIELGNYEQAREILIDDAPTDRQKSTTLLKYIDLDNPDAVQLLCQTGANVNNMKNRMTAVEIAMSKNRWKCAEILCSFDDNSEQEYRFAVENDDPSHTSLKFLLEHAKKPTDTSLREAVDRCSNTECLALMLEHGAAPGRAAIESAIRCYKENPEFLEILLKYTHAPDSNLSRPCIAAAMNKNNGCMESLLKAGFRPQPDQLPQMRATPSYVALLEKYCPQLNADTIRPISAYHPKA